MNGTRGRVAVITGAASGIGEATARLLAEEGWAVAVADFDAISAAAVAAEIPNALPIEVDVRETPSVEAMVERTVAELGGIDALVACAGVIDPVPSHQMTDESLARLLDVHVGGALRCARGAFAALAESGHGAFVVMSSIYAHIGIPQRLSYSAAKGALEASVRVLAVEWAHHGVRVNGIAPGWVRTPLTQSAIDRGHVQESELSEAIPLKRLAEPEEIAAVVEFLISPAASYLTGQTLLVDGGATAYSPVAAPRELRQAG